MFQNFILMHFGPKARMHKLENVPPRFSFRHLLSRFFLFLFLTLLSFFKFEFSLFYLERSNSVSTILHLIFLLYLSLECTLFLTSICLFLPFLSLACTLFLTSLCLFLPSFMHDLLLSFIIYLSLLIFLPSFVSSFFFILLVPFSFLIPPSHSHLSLLLSLPLFLPSFSFLFIFLNHTFHYLPSLNYILHVLFSFLPNFLIFCFAFLQTKSIFCKVAYPTFILCIKSWQQAATCSFLTICFVFPWIF